MVTSHARRMRRGVCGLLVLAACAASSWAQGNFVDTNDDWIPNTVSAFTVSKDGVLMEIPGSPFLTGGNGARADDFRFFASKRVVTVGNFVYASNMRSSSVSGLSIDAKTGELTPVAGSPFPIEGSPGLGISLAITLDGRFLYAGDEGSSRIVSFSRGSQGELTRLGNPVPTGRGINGMVASPDGRWLAVALTFHGPHGAVAMFGIDAETGELTPVAGSPFPMQDPGGQGAAAGLDINCASDVLFVGMGRFGTTVVEVFRIDPDTGSLNPIEGSPFSPGVGVNSNVPLLSPDDSLLFVSNQANTGEDRAPTITVFTVAPDGSLNLVPDSPFPVGGGVEPAGMAADKDGRFLYVTVRARFRKDDSAFVGVFAIGLSGELTAVPGSPFPTSQPEIGALAAFPAKVCPAKGK